MVYNEAEKCWEDPARYENLKYQEEAYRGFYFCMAEQVAKGNINLSNPQDRERFREFVRPSRA